MSETESTLAGVTPGVTPETPVDGDGARYVEVWNDLVSPRDLTWSIVICAGTTAAALGIATALDTDTFFWGLGGAVVGFVIAALVFSPKREVHVLGEDSENSENAGEDA